MDLFQPSVSPPHPPPSPNNGQTCWDLIRNSPIHGINEREFQFVLTAMWVKLVTLSTRPQLRVYITECLPCARKYVRGAEFAKMNKSGAHKEKGFAVKPKQKGLSINLRFLWSYWKL